MKITKETLERIIAEEKEKMGIDKNKADIDKDGKLAGWEMARAKAIAKSKSKKNVEEMSVIQRDLAEGKITKSALRKIISEERHKLMQEAYGLDSYELDRKQDQNAGLNDKGPFKKAPEPKFSPEFEAQKAQLAPYLKKVDSAPRELQKKAMFGDPTYGVSKDEGVYQQKYTRGIPMTPEELKGQIEFLKSVLGPS